tara:strand:+ start:1988 stop:2845 length:858 start_codon:yes stop_codon:yes gene_type:complete
MLPASSVIAPMILPNRTPRSIANSRLRSRVDGNNSYRPAIRSLVPVEESKDGSTNSAIRADGFEEYATPHGISKRNMHERLFPTITTPPLPQSRINPSAYAPRRYTRKGMIAPQLTKQTVPRLTSFVNPETGEPIIVYPPHDPKYHEEMKVRDQLYKLKRAIDQQMRLRNKVQKNIDATTLKMEMENNATKKKKMEEKIRGFIVKRNFHDNNIEQSQNMVNNILDENPNVREKYIRGLGGRKKRRKSTKKRRKKSTKKRRKKRRKSRKKLNHKKQTKNRRKSRKI